MKEINVFKDLVDSLDKSIKNTNDFKEAYHISFESQRNKDTTELYNKYFSNIEYKIKISDNVLIINSLDDVVDFLITNNVVCLVDRVPFEYLCNKYIKLKEIKSIIYVDDIESGDDLKNISTSLKDEIIIGIGGGRTLDILKFISFKSGNLMLAIPSSLTTHVYASKKIHALPQIKEFGHTLTIDGDEPHISFLDISMLSDLESTKKRLIYSGFGDIMAFINAKCDWELAIKNSKNIYNEVADYFVEYVIDRLKQIYTEAKFEEWVAQYALIQVALCNITHWAGSAPASGAEHLFAKCIEEEVEALPLHGEVVALGVLIFCYIREKDVQETMKLLQKFHISTNFQELYIHKKAVINALVNSHKEGLRKGRYTILDELENSSEYYTSVIDAMISDGLIKES